MTAALPLPLPLPDPPLEAAGLCLRPWAVADARVLAAAWADPEIARWTGVPQDHDEAAAARWIAGEAERRARGLALDLVVEADEEPVGEVGLSTVGLPAGWAEVGWWVAAGRRGRGVATRATSLFAAWALSELHIEALVARCPVANPASGAVAKAAGFAPVRRHEGVEVWSLGPGGPASLEP